MDSKNFEYLVDGWLSDTRVQPFLDADTVIAEELYDLYEIANRTVKRALVPFFDEEFYLKNNPDVAASGLSALFHFIEYGVSELRSPHRLIDFGYMRELRPDLFEHEISLKFLTRVLKRNLISASPFFDAAFYAKTYMDGSTAGGELVHYLTSGVDANYQPNPFFDPRYIKQKYSERGLNGVELLNFFLDEGDRDCMEPSREFSPAWYSEQYPDCDTLGPLVHFLRHGRLAGRDPKPSHGSLKSGGQGATSGLLAEWTREEDPYDIVQGYDRLTEKVEGRRLKALQEFREAELPMHIVEDDEVDEVLQTLKFERTSDPQIDIILPCYNQLEKTLECLLSLKDNEQDVSFRVILADDASPDERMRQLENIEGLVYYRQEKNLHFLLNCNSVLHLCSAPYVLLLNNDTQLRPNSLKVLLDELIEDETLSAVVPKMLYPNGRLQEAGCRILDDGETDLVGLGADPALPQFNRPRLIGYGSGACLLVRATELNGELFDERFAPAYCEDVDLCLRLTKNGGKIKYVPEAELMHHLSVSTRADSEKKRRQGAIINQDILFSKWQKELAEMRQARVLAFYLPQMHPFMQNDFWWGKGFTEWTNVSKAMPGYAGHYQPHLPADFGFYDLRLPSNMVAQQELARRYGVEGFVMYYYNFGGAKVMETPFENLQADRSIDFTYTLCWANENWTKHWDGGEKAPLLTQLYDDDTINGVIDDVIRLVRDERAIRVNGKTMFAIYRPLLFPDILKTTNQMRERVLKETGEELHLVYVESMEAVQKGIAPAELGFDACVEFPPQGIAEKFSGTVTPVREWAGNLYDYEGTVANAVLRGGAGYPRYPGCFPSWDNTPRQPQAGTVIDGALPELFQKFVEYKLDEMDTFFVGEERFLFVNAWNEWAEGAHLEPDRAFGHQWLMSLRNALVKKGCFPSL